MNDDELMEFMTSFGGGGRPIGMDANFGQGFKSSCFSWNPFGIIVMSWTEKTPEGRMIWIERNEEGDYGLREIDIMGNGGESEQVVVPDIDHTWLMGLNLAALRPQQITDAGHGTVFILLGKSFEDDTEVESNRDRPLQRGIAKYLNERFIKIPDGVSVHSIGLGAKKVDSDRRFTKDKTITTQNEKVYDLHSRRVRGMSEFIPKREANGSVCVDKHGTRIDWYLCKEAGSAGDPSYRPEGARIVVAPPESAKILLIL